MNNLFLFLCTQADRKCNNTISICFRTRQKHCLCRSLYIQACIFISPFGIRYNVLGMQGGNMNQDTHKTQWPYRYYKSLMQICLSITRPGFISLETSYPLQRSSHNVKFQATWDHWGKVIACFFRDLFGQDAVSFSIICFRLEIHHEEPWLCIQLKWEQFLWLVIA